MKNLYLKSTIIGLLVSASLFAQAQETKKIAIASFYGDRRIEVPGVSALVMEKLLKDSTFNLVPIVKKSYDAFVEGLKGSPIEIVSNDLVINNETYKTHQFANEMKTEEGFFGLFFTSVNGLRSLYPRDLIVANEELPPAVLGKAFQEAGVAEGTLYVALKFKAVDSMFGSKIQATLELELFNAEGKKIFVMNPDATSDDSVFTAVGGMAVLLAQREKLIPMCQQAVDKLINEELKEKFPKMTKKIIKKWN